MRRATRVTPLLALLLAGIAIAAGSGRALVAQAGTAPPKLLVIAVIDQMRADYLETFRSRWHAGFATLLAEGAVFERAAYPYMNTVTCAGHSTIGTGTLPRTHGMVLNAWWHREERALRNCMDDEAAPNVGYGKAAPGGNSAKRLLVPTLADELRAQRPGARVVSLSLKPRSAIGLAGHGGDAVTWFDEGADVFVTSQAFAREPVKAVADFIAANPPAADAGKVWSLSHPAASYRFPDASIGARPPQSWSGLFPHPIAGRTGADGLFYTVWQSSPFADAYLSRMAGALVDAFGLGRRDAPDFLGVSFSSLDLVGHAYGPRSREVEDHLVRLDETLGAFIARLDRAVGRDRYTLALTADHGVADVPVPGISGRVATDEVRERIEETLISRFGPSPTPYVTRVVFNYVYLADGVAERLRAAADWQAVQHAVLDLPGVDRVLRADHIDPASSDPVVRAAALSFRAERSGDIVVTTKSGWFLAARGEGAGTTHGTAYAYDQRVPVILFGHGVAAGRYRQAATPADIAPTLARLAGIRMPKAEGRALTEALR